MSRTDTQLFDDIEKVRNHPSFVEEEDGWVRLYIFARTVGAIPIITGRSSGCGG